MPPRDTEGFEITIALLYAGGFGLLFCALLFLAIILPRTLFHSAACWARFLALLIKQSEIQNIIQIKQIITPIVAPDIEAMHLISQLLNSWQCITFGY